MIPAEAARIPTPAKPSIQMAPARPFGLPSVWELDARLDWMIDELIPKEAMTLICAASGTGKSWLAYAIAGAVSRGGKFLGREVKVVCPVLYLDSENGLRLVKRNLEVLAIHANDQLNIWGGWHRRAMPSLDEDDREFAEWVDKYKPLLIFDSLIHFHTGDESSASDTRECMNAFRNLVNLGATVIILHHTGKAETAKKYRGSSDIEASVDVAYSLAAQTSGGKLVGLEMRSFKSRYGIETWLGMRLNEGRGFELQEAQHAPTRSDAEEVIKKLIADNPGNCGTRIVELATDRGIGTRRAREVLATLPSEKGRGNSRLYYAPDMQLSAPREPEVVNTQT